jgi:peptide/nickel transport system substrate-binding protein
VVPDLATDTGRPTNNNTVWTFTLKPNVRWEGGELVTCSQVKYGIERRFSSLLQDEGPRYPKTYLIDNPTPYQGPYVGNDNGGVGLASIVCVDEREIEFHLSRPIGDFGYTLAMPTWAPVLPAQDTKDQYEKRPYSNGPYKILSYDDTKLVMVRNPYWSPTNDQVRKAYPDKIVITFLSDVNGKLTNDIMNDQGDARNTVMLDSNVAPNFLQEVVNDPTLSARTISGVTGGLRYIAINTQRITDIDCREALIYAFDKRRWRTLAGGSVIGDYATTFIPPNVKAYKNFDLFDTTANPEGQPDKAMEIMNSKAQSGHPCPTTVHVAFKNTPLYTQLVQSMVVAYQPAGIQVIPVPLDRSTYYTTGIGDPANPYDMMVAGWVPDWANGSAILPPVFDGRNIPPLNAYGHAAGNVNFSLLDDKTIEGEMDAAEAEFDPARAYALWGNLDEEIQKLAVTIPIIYDRAVLMTGSNVLGGYIHPAFGEPDLVSLGLAQP